MNDIKRILARYSAFLWHILQPLGIWGAFIGSALDGAAIGLPVDIVVAAYVSQNHHKWLLYVIMAAAGSAVGSLVIYGVGYWGGEEFLRKRVSAARFEKLHNAFEKHPFWSLMFPAMLPPPTPFKAIVLASAVAEMSVTHFLLAIFFGRVIRFAALALIVMQFGPGEVHKLRIFFSHHFHWILLAVAVAVVVWVLGRRRKARMGSRSQGE
jgi:membrane protein YqaA with SNARE-associated domain